jgi:hypothetical protein
LAEALILDARNFSRMAQTEHLPIYKAAYDGENNGKSR